MINFLVKIIKMGKRRFYTAKITRKAIVVGKNLSVNVRSSINL